MIKKMVRLALASEYSRLPIRRNDISTKVLGEQGSREFKVVFEQAQHELRSNFGMEMSELPAREKATIAQKRGSYICFFLCLHYSTLHCTIPYTVWFLILTHSNSGPKNRKTILIQ
jgi:hypothetical protein